jgi:hypothetical protein
MKTKKLNVTACPKSRIAPSKALSKFFLGTMAAAVLPLAVSSVQAEDAAPAPPPPLPPPSRTDALLSFQFSDKYLTPRGMIVHETGLDFQVLALGLINIYKGDSFINDVTLVPGIWNDFSSDGVSVHAPFGSDPKSAWVEIDPIAGVSVSFAKHFKLDVTYTAFNMQILDIGTSQHVDTKLSFDDSAYLKAFALHPYFEYWQEIVNKATAADVPYLVDPLGKHLGSGPGSSYYFEVGVAPSYTFQKCGLKLELPCRVLLPNKDFYGEYYGSSSTVGLYEVGIKASLPLKFMPQGYGHWSFSAGFKYMGFEDKNLQDMQAFNAPGKSVSGATQVFAGISTFF